MRLTWFLPSLAIVASSTATPTSSDGSVLIPLIKNTKSATLNGPAQLRKVYNKFGWTLPSSSSGRKGPVIDVNSGSATSTAGGIVSATPEAYHSEYLCAVKIGDQELMLDVDTGSTDLWMFSTYMNSSAIGDHTAFDPSTSPLYKNDTGATWKIEYADASGASGVVGYDKVTIGGITQTSQAVELATTISASFAADMQSDGIFGLGFDLINEVRPNKVRSWFQQVKGKLSHRVFSVNLKEDGSGFYQFGLITPNAYTGALTRVSCNYTNGWWEFESPAFSFNGSTVYNMDDPSPAIADTGTTLLVLDDVVADYYYSNVPNSGFSEEYNGYLFPCSQAESLPSFGVAMGSADFIVDIPVSLLTYGPVDDTYCYGAIQGNNGYPLQIFGDILYRSAFVVHEDWRNTPGTLGFLGLAVGAKA